MGGLPADGLGIPPRLRQFSYSGSAGKACILNRSTALTIRWISRWLMYNSRVFHRWLRNFRQGYGNGNGIQGPGPCIALFAGHRDILRRIWSGVERQPHPRDRHVGGCGGDSGDESMVADKVAAVSRPVCLTSQLGGISPVPVLIPGRGSSDALASWMYFWRNTAPVLLIPTKLVSYNGVRLHQQTKGGLE